MVYNRSIRNVQIVVYVEKQSCPGYYECIKLYNRYELANFANTELTIQAAFRIIDYYKISPVSSHALCVHTEILKD